MRIPIASPSTLISARTILDLRQHAEDLWTPGSLLHSTSTWASTIMQRQDSLVRGRLVVLHHVELVVLDQVVQERAESIQGEADHVVVVAFDASHQQRAAALCTPAAKGRRKHALSVILPTLREVSGGRDLT